jgi:hypothetical protein
MQTNEITPDSPIANELMKLKPDLTMERGKLSDAVDNQLIWIPPISPPAISRLQKRSHEHDRLI